MRWTPTTWTYALTVHNCLIVFMQAHDADTWTGTASDLLEQLHLYRKQCAAGGVLPSNGHSLAVIVQRRLPVLANMHLGITVQRVGKQRTRLLSIAKEQGFHQEKHFLFPL